MLLPAPSGVDRLVPVYTRVSLLLTKQHQQKDCDWLHQGHVERRAEFRSVPKLVQAEFLVQHLKIYLIQVIR